MLTIKQLKNFKGKSPGDIGIEIEMEGTEPLITLNEIPWFSKADGSLRNFGVEYVTDPLHINKVEEAMNFFMKKMEKQPWIRNCPRTSTHIHVNVWDHTVIQYINAIVIAYLLDNVMLKFCNKFREANQYCLRLKDAEDVLRSLYKFLERADTRLLMEDKLKYASVNIYTMSKFGTIEFRAMDGDVDTKRIVNWVNLCYHIVEAGKKFETPSQIIEHYYTKGVDSLLETIFPSNLLKIFCGVDITYPVLIQENVCRVYKLAYFHTNWIQWLETTTKEKHSRKKKEEDFLFQAPSTRSAYTLNTLLNQTESAVVTTQPQRRSQTNAR